VIEYVPTDLTEMVKRLVALFRMRTKRHTLVLSAEPDIIAEVDQLSIERVVSNLLDNAIKYSPNGGQIDIELSRAERSDAERARLAVRDRGIGIPPEMRASIFDRFYQAHASDHRSGLGLGLYISREIVNVHGGDIVAEFPADGGTRFVVRLPCAARAQPLVASSDGAPRRYAQHRQEVDV
jgi:signal transduction histidine kinase